MELLGRLQTIPILEPADWQAGSKDFDSINMGKLNAVRLILIAGAQVGDGASIKLYSGATAGAKTTELGFKYRVTGTDLGAASADLFGPTPSSTTGARTAVAAGASGLVFTTSADWNLRTVEIDIEADQMTDGEEWLTIESDDGTASSLFWACVAIGVPRFAGDLPPTAL